MLKKFITVRNVGKFLQSAGPNNPTLSQHSLILGANGQGKSTLCAILRSLKTQNPDYVAGRHRLGEDDPPYIELLFTDGHVRFDNAAWSSTRPHLAIFDGEFVAENVHSGEVVEIDHKRNLYRVIVGEQGVRLAEEETRLVGLSRETTTKIGKLSTAIEQHIPNGMKLNDFVALPDDPDIGTKCKEQEKVIEASLQTEQIEKRKGLSSYVMPKLPGELESLVSRTLSDIAQDSETQFVNHLKNHKMEKDGSNWIAKGLDYTLEDTCPFCGQSIKGVSLIRAYQSVFSNQYKKLKTDITSMQSQISNLFGDRALGEWRTLTEQNKSAIEFWNRYCDFDAASLLPDEDLYESFESFGEILLALLRRKNETPLERIPLDHEFAKAADAYNSATNKIDHINALIHSVNDMIKTKKNEIDATDPKDAIVKLATLEAIRVRHTDSVDRLCTDYQSLNQSKKTTDTDKAHVRKQLNAHSQNVIKPYENRINELLETFNAGFRISQTKHNFKGGTAASSYQLVINKTSVDLGDARTAINLHSFKNTLSSGDRATLALAFFLAHLETDPSLADKIVVFDDPFNSQDAFRRRRTLHEINRIARKCAQVIVLSHDATFLWELWNKAPAGDRVALNLADHRTLGSKIMPLDLENACKGRTAKDIDDLQTYVTTGSGEVEEVIRKIRLVLETFMWTTYPSCFQQGHDSLGKILQKIRDGGDEHPAKDLYDDLKLINEYTQTHHHGENQGNISTDSIDDQELNGFTKQTLKIVNALQA